jgi:uncharacterized protein YuzE
MWLRNMQKFNFSYDRENDDLFLFSKKSKSKGSVEMGDLVLDYNSKKELVGIELANASRFIKDVTGENFAAVRKTLCSLKECKVDVKCQRNLLIIKIYLLGEKEIAPVISIPSLKENSPALAYA